MYQSEIRSAEFAPRSKDNLEPLRSLNSNPGMVTQVLKVQIQDHEGP